MTPGERWEHTKRVRATTPHWLYRCFDADDVLLYVGQTRDPVARFSQWFSRGSVWLRVTRRVDWQQFPNYDAVIAAEKRAIETERPVHNVYHQPKLVAR